MLKRKKQFTTTNKKSLRNRLVFALSEKEEKGFLSKNNKKIEVLELEEKKKKHHKKVNHKKIEYLELDNQPVKKKKVHKEQIEILDFEENTKYEEKSLPIQKFIKKNFDVSMIVMSTVAVILLTFSFFVKQDSLSIRVKRFLDGLGIYTSEVKNIEIASNDYDNPGSWQINKSVKWIKNRQVQVTIDVDSVAKESSNQQKDVIFVFDTSSSMSGTKFDQAKDTCKEIITSLLTNNQNRVALISYNSDATILSSFSNDQEELFSALDTMIVEGNRNHNAALTKVNELLTGYTKEADTDLIVVLLSNGYSTMETPNEEAAYDILKENYPDSMVQGIQYATGSDEEELLADISDKNWIADKKTLENALVEAVILPKKYESFVVTDTIDSYFTIESVNDIEVTKGTAALTEESGKQVVTWNIGDDYSSGTNQTMNILLELKEQYFEEEGFIPVDEKTTAISKFSDESEKSVSDTRATVLKNNFNVIYEINAPEGCDLEQTQTENHLIFETVSKRTDEFSCDGYVFKGWEIDESTMKDVKRINDDTFIMPSHDVYIRGTWTKQDIVKTMDGTVYERTTLYKILESEAQKGVYAKEYTGAHQDSMDASLSTKKIYHWYGSDNAAGNDITDMYNVIFADQCWQILRTTDTGGVRMIYNGEAENDQCLSTRGTHTGYVQYQEKQTLSSAYYYGSDYTYDKENNLFSLAGDIKQVTWNATTASSVYRYYTCKKTTAEGTCSKLYYVISYSSATQGNVVPLNGSASYYEYGELAYQVSANHVGAVGYKYGDPYTIKSTNSINEQSFSSSKTLIQSAAINTNHWYADSYNYDPDSASPFSLDNPYKVTSSEYAILVGKYTFSSTSQTASSTSVRYIVGVSGSNYYYVSINDPDNEEGMQKLAISDSITDNQDGTYSLDSPEYIPFIDYYTNYSSYKNKYTCGVHSTDVCENPQYIVTSTSTGYTGLTINSKYIVIAKERDDLTLEDTLLIDVALLLINKDNYADYHYTCNSTSTVCEPANLRYIHSYTATSYKFAPNRYYANSITWVDDHYVLNDPLGLEAYKSLTDIKTHHYFCVASGEQECTTVAYIHYYTSVGSTIRYDEIKGGASSITEALQNMFTQNNHDSFMKIGVEAWYEKYLLDYSDYIEDTIYCNDRRILTPGAWGPNNNPTSYLYFYGSSANYKILSCANVTDRFSVSNDQAKLKYPVAIVSLPEINILNNANISKSGNFYWSISPGYSNESYGREAAVSPGGALSTYYNGTHAMGVRPVISLKPSTKYESGTGSKDDPYIIDYES